MIRSSIGLLTVSAIMLLGTPGAPTSAIQAQTGAKPSQESHLETEDTFQERDIFSSTFFHTGNLGRAISEEIGGHPFSASRSQAKEISEIASYVEEDSPGVLKNLVESADSGDLSGTRDAILEIAEILSSLQTSEDRHASTFQALSPSMVSPTAWVIIKIFAFWPNSSSSRQGVPDMTPDSELALDRLTLALVKNMASK